jgi:hypothetical protein
MRHEFRGIYKINSSKNLLNQNDLKNEKKNEMRAVWNQGSLHLRKLSKKRRKR